MQRWSIATSCIVLASVLSACSGGSTAGGGGGSTPAPKYVAFTNSSSATTTTLGGQAINTDSNAISAVTGGLKHNTRSLVGFSAAGVTLTNTGRDIAGVWSDGTTTLSPISAELSQYSFAGFYHMQNDPASASASVIIGAVTQAADMPVTGDVTYTGDALLQGTSINGAMSGQGNSKVDVSFANRTADITIDAIGGAAYDTAKITGVALSTDRTGLSGGTLQLTNGGADVTSNLLGAAPAHNLAGDFFGLDTNDNPDEVGGIFHTEGSNGALSGSFLAD